MTVGGCSMLFPFSSVDAILKKFPSIKMFVLLFCAESVERAEQSVVQQGVSVETSVYY